MEYRHFKDDSFFPANNHPNPQPFIESEFYKIVEKIENSRPVRISGHKIESEPLKGSIPNQAVNTIKNSSSFNTGQNRGTQSNVEPDHIPYNENNNELLNTSSLKTDILQNEFQIEAVKILVARGFDVFFIWYSKYSGRDMRLIEKENAILVDSFIPVIKKYSKGNFKYAEELGFVLAFGGVILSKSIFMNAEEVKKEDSKNMSENKLDPTIETTAKGMMEVLKENLKKGDVQARNLDDLEFQKAKKLISIYNPSMEASRRDCENFVALLESMGMNIDFLSSVAEQIDPETLKKMFGSIKIG